MATTDCPFAHTSRHQELVDGGLGTDTRRANGRVRRSNTVPRSTSAYTIEVLAVGARVSRWTGTRLLGEASLCGRRKVVKLEGLGGGVERIDVDERVVHERVAARPAIAADCARARDVAHRQQLGRRQGAGVQRLVLKKSGVEDTGALRRDAGLKYQTLVQQIGWIEASRCQRHILAIRAILPGVADALERGIGGIRRHTAPRRHQVVAIHARQVAGERVGVLIGTGGSKEPDIRVVVKATLVLRHLALAEGRGVGKAVGDERRPRGDAVGRRVAGRRERTARTGRLLDVRRREVGDTHPSPQTFEGIALGGQEAGVPIVATTGFVDEGARHFTGSWGVGGNGGARRKGRVAGTRACSRGAQGVGEADAMIGTTGNGAGQGEENTVGWVGVALGKGEVRQGIDLIHDRWRDPVDGIKGERASRDGTQREGEGVGSRLSLRLQERRLRGRVRRQARDRLSGEVGRERRVDGVVEEQGVVEHAGSISSRSSVPPRLAVAIHHEHVEEEVEPVLGQCLIVHEVDVVFVDNIVPHEMGVHRRVEADDAGVDAVATRASHVGERRRCGRVEIHATVHLVGGRPPVRDDVLHQLVVVAAREPREVSLRRDGDRRGQRQAGVVDRRGGRQVGELQRRGVRRRGVHHTHKLRVKER